MLVLLLAQLVALYFLSRWVSKSLFILFLFVFRTRSVAISLLLALTFPGTVIHELAHLFTAEILRVPTGKLTLVPESIRDAHIKTGSVAIAETDPFRRYAIGLAPLFAGLLVLTAIAYLMSNWSNLTNWTNWVALYFLFAVSNSMFSSPEDLKGFLPFVFVVGLFVGAGYFLGLRFELTGPLLNAAVRTLTTLTDSLTIVLAVNLGLLVASWGLMRLLLRVFHVRTR